MLILPYLGRVMIGTTDIRIDNPDDAVISDEEIDYILGMVDKGFPGDPGGPFAYRLQLFRCATAAL